MGGRGSRAHTAGTRAGAGLPGVTWGRRLRRGGALAACSCPLWPGLGAQGGRARSPRGWVPRTRGISQKTLTLPFLSPPCPLSVFVPNPWLGCFVALLCPPLFSCAPGWGWVARPSLHHPLGSLLCPSPHAPLYPAPRLPRCPCGVPMSRALLPLCPIVRVLRSVCFPLRPAPVRSVSPPGLLKEKERKAAGGSGSEDVGGLLGVSGRPRSGPGPGALLASLLWERPLPFGDVDDVDLDAFLLEHGLPPSPPDPGPPAPRAALAPGAAAPSCSSGSSSPAQSSSSSPAPTPTPASPRLSPGGHVLGRRAPGAGPVPRDTPSPVDPESVEVLMTFDPDPADLALSSVPGQDTFDPRKHRFSEEELKPQPIMKKARKIQVPEEQKDEKYWSRRYKNNEAAKRSRDARRLKENQISVRAAFLEKENALLRQEVVAVRQELSHYRAVLSRYQAQHGAL
ncbi:D site-binding protein isoform X2 [Monodelphis domestica]|uniref:D site-binding protein isoform X2 n=1 Tax=Monodelphis domestica TaxID=13616 RepID=UPI0024E21FEB|nr:D site-binding protein isoform X2 [Monodelphis domestica]